MPLFVKVRSFLRNLISTRGVEADLDQEVHSHLEMLIEETIRAGMPPKEAQRAARIELGGIERVKEQVREERIGNWLRSVLSDCRYGIRQLRKNPSFTAVAVLTLALGIGANTAIFTIFDAVLLESFSVREPSRLVLFTDNLGEGSYSGDPPSNRWEAFSIEVSDYLRKQRLPFESLAAFRSGEDRVTVRLPDAPSANGLAERAQVHLVSGNYFNTMGVDSVMGRAGV